MYNGHTIRDKTAGYKNKECVFMLDFSSDCIIIALKGADNR